MGKNLIVEWIFLKSSFLCLHFPNHPLLSLFTVCFTLVNSFFLQLCSFQILTSLLPPFLLPPSLLPFYPLCFLSIFISQTIHFYFHHFFIFFVLIFLFIITSLAYSLIFLLTLYFFTYIYKPNNFKVKGMVTVL